jgi:hypothetical protein
MKAKKPAGLKDGQDSITLAPLAKRVKDGRKEQKEA